MLNAQWKFYEFKVIIYFDDKSNKNEKERQLIKQIKLFFTHHVFKNGEYPLLCPFKLALCEGNMICDIPFPSLPCLFTALISCKQSKSDFSFYIAE